MEIFIAKSGCETGPYAEEQIRPMLESGMIGLTDSVWHQGMSGWTPVHQFLDIKPPVPGSPETGQGADVAGLKVVLDKAREMTGTKIGACFANLKNGNRKRTLGMVVVALTLLFLSLVCWKMFMSSSSKLAGVYWPVCAKQGRSPIASHWEENEISGRVRVDEEAEQPWFDGIGDFSRMELTRWGKVILTGEPVGMTGSYCLIEGDKLQLVLKVGQVEEVVTLPVEIKGDDIIVSWPGGGPLAGGYRR